MKRKGLISLAMVLACALVLAWSLASPVAAADGKTLRTSLINSAVVAFLMSLENFDTTFSRRMTDD